MSPNLEIGWLRGARFRADFARSNYVEIGWDLWGILSHFLPQGMNSYPSFDYFAEGAGRLTPASEAES
jgi:hypothetical protein